MFRALRPPGQLESNIARLVTQAAAPCATMAFLWSRLCGGEPHFTLSQVALNDVLVTFRPAPIVALRLGLAAISVPWRTLVLSVARYVGIPVVIGPKLHRALLPRADGKVLAQLLRRLQPVTRVAVLTPGS